MTASKLKIPQFIPCAIAESDFPKHAEQAHAEAGCSAAAARAASAILKIVECFFMRNPGYQATQLQVTHILELFQKVALIEDQPDPGRQRADAKNEVQRQPLRRKKALHFPDPATKSQRARSGDEDDMECFEGHGW